jgi:hypothetical protein
VGSSGPSGPGLFLRRFVGLREELVEDFLSQFCVLEQRAVRIGDDELVAVLAVANGEGVPVVVLDEPDDIEFDRAPVGRLDGEGITELQRAGRTLRPYQTLRPDRVPVVRSDDRPPRRVAASA